jgi:hypothetical protein
MVAEAVVPVAPTAVPPVSAEVYDVEDASTGFTPAFGE